MVVPVQEKAIAWNRSSGRLRSHYERDCAMGTIPIDGASFLFHCRHPKTRAADCVFDLINLQP
jgi:hypothetical protein